MVDSISQQSDYEKAVMVRIANRLEGTSDMRGAAVAYLKNAFTHPNFDFVDFERAQADITEPIHVIQLGVSNLSKMPDRNIHAQELNASLVTGAMQELGAMVVSGRLKASDVSPQTIKSMMDALKLKGKENELVVEAAAYNLARLGVQEAIPGIRKLLDHGRFESRGELSRLVRRDAVVSLAILGDKESIPAMRKKLFAAFRRESERDLGYVALSLVVLGEKDEKIAKEAIKVAERSIKDSDYRFVNGEALFALKLLGKGDANITRSVGFGAHQEMSVDNLIMNNKCGNSHAALWAKAAMEKFPADNVRGGSSVSDDRNTRSFMRGPRYDDIVPRGVRPYNRNERNKLL